MDEVDMLVIWPDWAEQTFIPPTSGSLVVADNKQPGYAVSSPKSS